MEAFQTKQLADSQLEEFDDEFISPKRLAKIRACIDRDFPDGDFSFLDLGGGNGMFADQLLELYPNAQGAVADNSKLLIERNQAHPRKETILSAIEDLHKVVDRQYDIVFLNFVLHHLVGSSFTETRNNQRNGLRVARQLLSPRGRVSIFEIVYDGKLIRSAPSLLIYQLTASKLLKPVVSKLGANTAGVGVCFLSEKQWRESMNTGGLQVDDFSLDEPFELSTARAVLLHVSSARRAFFWCAGKD